MDLSICSRSIVSGKHPSFWVVSSGRINLVLCLTSLRVFNVWELRKVRLYSDNPSIQQSQSQIASGELQGVAGGRGELSCRGGETDTTLGICSFGVCLFVNISAHCSGPDYVWSKVSQ